jgi:hypothetical protein
MSIARIRNAFPCFAHSLVICAALVYGPRPAFAQTPDSFDEKVHEAQSVSGTSPSSDQASENQHPQRLQSLTEFECATLFFGVID